ncbi:MULTISPECIES: iron-containing redox enzyme family protein [unclassified Arthrobacter]|uniref:iron-containing redox enzyme family protein n=1 Tax=unclassified Arthrobacter TaxID=235627 RepID=UPI001E5982DE|nr:MULTISPECIES: iron-containing redox enzyme family protein [unclassified Arthrobacter]MCC9144150.1 iron-containing redox enzyme family protein [Arthrobacter sp. zg-Y919]MDK1275375.1 iron-containing redox enzyme family protein [Arthrobacter sp. zg.Y919]MDM7991007.1 iron-containing redox enzyme family protein [Arthrobacter sp. zg-Y877]WIB03240.1 iron-containing redox enzyme family protein [Arthrobacter sp. zg-Y919]
MKIPAPRGRVSATLLDLLQNRGGAGHANAYGSLNLLVDEALAGTPDLLRDEDLQLALFCLYELHYSGLDGVEDAAEWDPELIRVRARMEAAFEDVLRAVVPVPALPAPESEAVAESLFRLAADDKSPGASRFVAGKASVEQLQEFLILRSVYQLKEADPHSWAIPRLPVGRAKAALVEIQADEYGGGRVERMHSKLFGTTMEGLGLDSGYGYYIDLVPALTLASSNAMSLFGLNRRLRGAIAGHLAAFEMTSSIPNSFYARGFRRHGFSDEVTYYFDEHVEADAVHEQIAARDLAGGLAEAEPDLLADIIFGAATVLAIDAMLAEDQLTAWQAGETALLTPLANDGGGTAGAALAATAMAGGVTP